MMSEGRVLQSAPSRQSWERDLHMLEAGHYCVITHKEHVMQIAKKALSYINQT